jgi:hypothetical protein
MSENNLKAIENFEKTLKKGTSAQQEYLLGLTESMALMADSRKRARRKPKPSK